MRIINAGNIVMNSYVYPISNGYVMIDTGYEHSMSGIEKKLQKQKEAQLQEKQMY